ncbi:uncharacterized protein PODANS_7_6900 [Podospora anserina S mat+]|uniref:Podospora anserina S mat+ genomic DNA chromosome 7, supercontig 1 n=2 Tax=Podospora TaxID=5144 RepID=B2AWE7_PODAN|nr:uncharacterized protein PODANS_7_6900 [Podospora anserina S mat+]CAP68721.1 unnamed protein product [Podospora anserina S mat+]CDP32191.1 Putative protein of unknown function [Podospora anserina S mat+]VBB86666.1 Putative protein of unknown function [Podospora comata]
MATDFIMPQMPIQQQQPQAHHFYSQPQQQQQQQQPYRAQQHSGFQLAPIATPYQPSTQQNTQVSPLSTSGNSPTSPKNYMTRQIRPLYVPAVLRPTEFPSKVPARPKSEHEPESPEEEPLRHSNSFMSLGGLSGGLSASLGLTRRSTGDSAKYVDGTWNLDLFPNPTGTPTRKHWKLDQDALICDHATCKKSFNTFTRRHHCRRCGNIFCGAHSDYQIPLDQDANYNPRGVPSRACAHCFNQFRAWRSRANSQSSSRGSSDGGNAPETPVTPTAAAPVAAIAPGLMRPLQARVAEVAHSVPRDWNWSTF